MDFLLLGPVEVRVEGRAVPLPRRQQRSLLAALLLRSGHVASTDWLVDALWGDHPPASAVGSLQNAVSQLRRALGADRLVTRASDLPPSHARRRAHNRSDRRGRCHTRPAASPAVRHRLRSRRRGACGPQALAALADRPARRCRRRCGSGAQLRIRAGVEKRATDGMLAILWPNGFSRNESS
jgi:hypothetical protein